MQATTETGRGIAIIGMAGRFPGAKSVELLWEKICEGADCLHYSTDEELKAAGIADWQIRHPEFVRIGGGLANAAEFDAQFFGFSAHDAALIDPQQRVFLECAWEAFEDAGYDPAESGAGVAVFAGGSVNGYRRQDFSPQIDTASMLGVIVGTERDFMATRVAYKLNLTGPAASVQTACSTSLVAVQMACDSLLNGNATMAIAGGVSITFPQGSGYIYQPGMILSPDGQCRAFDIKAAGTTMGRGAGAVLLKPLDAAVRDHDQIYAVIRGIAINNDGANKGGYTAPGVKGQSDVIRRSMKMAGFAPSSVKYVEAHGTGTEVGDSIEIAALTEAFSDGEVEQGSCTVSSLKPNIGHLDAAAGVANLIKASMALRHRVLPGVRHYETPNPELNLETSPFRISNAMSHYTDDAPFRAGVSSFGIGGTNVHASLEEWPAPQKQTAASLNGNGHHGAAKTQLFPLSANSAAALAAQREQLASHLASNPTQPLADVAYTMQKGRRLFAHRYFATASTREELVEELRAPAKLKTQSAVSTQKKPDVFFLFPGQGAQYVNMGRGLYDTDTVFHDTIDQCCAILEPILKFDLREILFPDAGHEEEATARLRQTSNTMPALVVLEYALAQKLLNSGVQPTALLGHSLGQYLAATLSGVFTLNDLLLLAAERGKLMKTMPTGSMLAVSLSEEEVLKQLPPELSIAAINGTKQIIVSGPTDVVQSFAAALSTQRVASQQLPTSHAFHSAMLDPIAEKTADLVRRFRLSKPTIPFLSNLTGTWITDEEALSPEYWAAHQRHAVRFADNLTALLHKGSGVLIEVGPGDTLIGFAKSAARGNKDVRLISTTRRAISQSTDAEHWQQTLGQLWLAGVKLDWDAVHGVERPYRTSLPTYPFERQHYWIDDEFGRPSYTTTKATGPLYKRDDLMQWIYAKNWRTAPMPPVTQREDSSEENSAPRHWVVFADEQNALLAGLRNAISKDNVVTSVSYGKSFEKISDSAYTLNPGEAQHFVGLFSALGQQELWPDHLLYASPAIVAGAPLRASFEHLFELGQALQQTGKFDGMTLHVLTDRAFDVLDEGRCQPTEASAATLADVMGVELRGIRRQVIDYDGEAPLALVTSQVHRELSREHVDDLVAFRGRGRWMPAWENLPVASAEIGQAHLRRGGTYILTGGVGGLGLVLAEHLAKTAAAHLILVGRSAFPSPDQWSALSVAPDTKAAMREKIQTLLRIQAAGGTVEILQGDVTDRERMRAVTAHARGTKHGLAGIIHAAGVVDYTVIGITESAAAVPRIFAAKAEGSAWIEDAIAAGGMDFVMLCSSMSAVMPSMGLSTYAGANAYLDAFAAAHDDREGTRVLSVNWDNWSETGMAVDAATMSKMKSEGAQEVKLGISNKEGGKIFDLLMNVPVSQAAVSTRDLPQLVEKARAVAKEDAPASMQLETSGGGAAHARPELSREYVAPENDVQRGVTEILQELLALERVGIHDDFFELGGHSLMGAQVIARIRERFAVSLPLRIIFDSPTAAAIAGLVEAKLPSSKGPSPAEAERVEIEI